ncbi:MAG: hypothetical protein HXX16_04950 [Bacteroidales bacterium]|nr:hypothetical protein [Bacteroidales bacterium]
MIFDPELKKALQMLSNDEKDKLILRLLKNDLHLANQLRFKLVETDSAEDKREQLKTHIIEQIQLATERYYSPGYLLMDARDISGKITEHVSITKDKLGEIVLNCLMLRLLLQHNNNRIASQKYGAAYTLSIYIVARVFKILMLIQKQHEDLHIEFQEDIEAIGELIGKNPNIMKAAISNGLDINWLVKFNIPENIASIYKTLREDGYLK